MMANALRSQYFDEIEGSHHINKYGSYQTRILSTSVTNYAPLFCIQMVTSLLSVFATIVVVRISVPKLDSTYQRYIFMLNIALMANSFFLGLNPLLAPEMNDYDNTTNGAYWAIGNAASCTTVGFFLIFGSLMVSMYHTAIAFYFYFSVETIQGNYKSKSKKKVKNERRLATTSRSESSAESSDESSDESSTAATIGSKAEIMANMACLFFPAVFAGAAATLDAFGFNPNVDLCTLYASTNVDNTSWLIIQSIFRWLLVTSGLFTLVITVVVRFRVGSFQKKENNEDVPADPISDDNKNSNASGSSLGDPDGAADDFERQIIGQKLNAISAQCLFYTLSYISSYVWFIALAFVSGSDGLSTSATYAIQTMTVIFYPLLGVFNCAIYVRPRVQMLQIMYPEDSNVAVLRVAMSKAGDPEEIEEVRAKIFGSDYCGPEGDDVANSEHSGGFVGGEDEPSPDSQIPFVVQFDQSTSGQNEALEISPTLDDQNDSVSQISDP